MPICFQVHIIGTNGLTCRGMLFRNKTILIIVIQCNFTAAAQCSIYIAERTHYTKTVLLFLAVCACESAFPYYSTLSTIMLMPSARLSAESIPAAYVTRLPSASMNTVMGRPDAP